MKNSFKLIIYTLIFSFVFSCNKDEVENIEAIRIVDVKDTLHLFRYDSFQLKLDIKGTGDLTYVSNNPNVFRVNREGLITAINGGIGKLLIVGSNGDQFIQTSCIVEVTALVDSISVAKKYKGINFLKNQTLNVFSIFTSFPPRATNGKLEYIVSDPKLAEIDEFGFITPLAKGEVTVHAKSTDGGNIVSDKIKLYTLMESEELDKYEWTVTASSSASSYYGPNRIIDNINSTFWHCPWSGAGTPPPYWLLVDLKEELEFDKIQIVRRSGYSDTRTVEILITNKTIDDIDAEDNSFVPIGKIEFGDDPNTITNKTLDWFPKQKFRTRYIKLYLPDTNREGNNSLSEIYISNVQ